MSRNAEIRCPNPACGKINSSFSTECYNCGVPLPVVGTQNDSAPQGPRPTRNLRQNSITQVRHPRPTRTSAVPSWYKTPIGMLLIGGVLLLLALAVILLLIKPLFDHSTHTDNPNPQDNPISVIKKGNDLIGISDGRFIFDAIRPDRDGKLQAAKLMSQPQPDLVAVENAWDVAVSKDTNDAEALIYKEDTRVLQSGQQYVTLIATTMFGALTSESRGVLQGVYVAQKAVNDGSGLNGKLVRVLIANTGGQTINVPQITNQIVRLARQDSTVVGIIGCLTSGATEAAVPRLKSAYIPMISETATDDALSGSSPYFYRVVPPNKFQGTAAARYAAENLKARSAAVFEDPNTPYSLSLAEDFKNQFTQDNSRTVSMQIYTAGQASTISARLTAALNTHPDIIYFAGYLEDANTLLTDLPPGTVPILGGDALYSPEGYTSSAHSGLSRLKFTTFAYPDEWEILGYKNQKPAFFNQYIAAFDPAQTHPGAYGYTRAGYVPMLSFDATNALLKGCNIALSLNNQITPDALNKALKQITGPNAIQGVSGQISFDQNGDPIDKEIVIAHFDAELHLQMDSANGSFLTK